MKRIGDMLPEPTKERASPQLPTTPTSPQTSRPDYTFEQKDATAYFFSKLQTAYPAEYYRAYPTVESLTAAKLDWIDDIGSMRRDDINELFSHLKLIRKRGGREARELAFMDICKILSLRGNDPEQTYRNRVDKQYIEDRHQHRLRMADPKNQAAAREAHAKHRKLMGQLFGQ